MGVLRYSTINVFSLPCDFLNTLFPPASCIVSTQGLLHIQNMCELAVYMIGNVPVNSQLLLVEIWGSHRLYAGLHLCRGSAALTPHWSRVKCIYTPAFSPLLRSSLYQCPPLARPSRKPLTREPGKYSRGGGGPSPTPTVTQSTARGRRRPDWLWRRTPAPNAGRGGRALR